MWEQSKVCIVLAWRMGGKDGWGWMDGGVDGVGSLLQVVRDMMEYDGVKQGFSPWIVLFGCDSCDAGWRKWIASLWRARIALHALLPCWHGWIVGWLSVGVLWKCSTLKIRSPRAHACSPARDASRTMARVFTSSEVRDQRPSCVFGPEIYDKDATEEVEEIKASCADAQKQARPTHAWTKHAVEVKIGYEHYDQRWRKDKQDIQLHRWIEERE